MIKTLFSFKGRVNRLKLLLVGLCITPFSIILNWNSPFLVLENPVFLIAAKVVLFPICWWISLALFIKRFHDLNKSGWWCLTLLIPIFNIYSLFILYFKKGTIGDNQYGEDPLNSVESHNVSYRNSIALTIIVLVILNLVYFSSNNLTTSAEDMDSKISNLIKLKFTEIEDKQFCYEDVNDKENYFLSSGTVKMIINQYKDLLGKESVNYNPANMNSLTIFDRDNKFTLKLRTVKLEKGSCVKIKSINKNSDDFSSKKNHDDFEGMIDYLINFKSDNPRKIYLGDIYNSYTENIGYKKEIKKFIDAVKTKDKYKIAEFIDYESVFILDHPSINTQREFIEKFDLIFDDYLLNWISNSDVNNDWEHGLEHGLKGILFMGGIISMDIDGKKVIQIYPTSKTPENKQNDTINANSKDEVQNTENTSPEVNVIGNYIGSDEGDMVYVGFDVKGEELWLIGNNDVLNLKENVKYNITYKLVKFFSPDAGEEIEVKELIKITQ